MPGLYPWAAFGVAAFFAWVELITSKYPRTVELLWRRSWALWAYTAVYGAIALGFASAYPSLAESGVLRFQTLEALSVATDTTGGDSKTSTANKHSAKPAANPTPQQKTEPKPTLTFLIAIMIGLSTKALLHIRLFSVPSAGTQQTFPVGTETIVQVFEPWLLRTILIDEFNAVRAYLNDRAGRHLDLTMVRARIIENLPAQNDYPQAEREALIADVTKAENVRSAMEIYLRAFGVKTLGTLFP